MPRLIFFCGHAGAGKTTLARQMATALMQRAKALCSGESFCLLDKDTLYGHYSSAVMGVLTGDPHDRDSPPYLEHLRQPEYQGLLDTMRENLALGISCVVVAPLSRELRAHQLADHDWLGISKDIPVRIVWVQLQEAEARRRIEARGNPNDAWKLTHWEAYRSRRFEPDPESYPELLFFDNTAPTPDDLAALLAQLSA